MRFPIRSPLSCLGLCLALVAVASEPEQIPAPRAGVLPAIPLTPEFPSRPLVTAEQPWRTPTPEEQEPTSSFIDSLKGNDSALEIIVAQGRLLSLREPLATEAGVAVIAVGDPTIVDFEVLPDQRMLRLSGKRVGVTDLSFVTADGRSYSLEVHVTYDLVLLSAQLKQVFPNAMIQLQSLREHVVVAGQARSTEQVFQILATVTGYLNSVQTSKSQSSRRGNAPQPIPGSTSGPIPLGDEAFPGDAEAAADAPIGLAYESGARANTSATSLAPQVINLLRVPESNQVMLKVTVAELDRQALREIGTDLTIDGHDVFFQNIVAGTGNVTAIFGPEFSMFMKALRTNSVVTVLAEPNLVTLSGYPAHFQSGGEFAVPQASQFGGFGGTIFKPFGIQLEFIPYILDNGVIRLTVRPEVSNVDETLSVSIIAGGDAVPGLRTRNASTTVELREGQTLAIAGLLNRVTSASTSRLPLLGDLPYVGALFSDTSHDVREQELIVLVTPLIVGGVDANQCIPLPGQEIMEPKDLELYLLGRISGRTGLPHRATTNWDDPLGIIRLQHLEKRHVYGPFGFSK